MRLLALAIVLALFSGEGFADAQLERSVDVGTRLSALVTNKNRFKPKTLANYVELRDKLKSEKCDGLKYLYYRVDDALYVVGSSRNGVTIGRHFGFKIAGDSVDLSSMRASTRGCLVLQKQPSSVSLAVTHILSDTPTEFHVFASLVAELPIYVGTKSAIWKVTGSSIDFVQQTEPRSED